MSTFFLLLELIGTIAFSASGAMTAMRKDMDVFGICILGLTTACGGGVIRDLILGNTPPATFQNPIYATVAIVTALIMMSHRVRRLLMHDMELYDQVMMIMDSLGLGIFTVMGIQIAFHHVSSPSLFLSVFVGVLTGVGGGVLRDVMAGDRPYIFMKHVYASASLAGAVLCVLMWDWAPELAAMLFGMTVIVLIRVLSAWLHWNLPHAREDG